MLFRRCFGVRKRNTLPSHQISIVSNDYADKSRFECLPNELIVHIFTYLNSCEIISAFSNLNHRFHSLLSSSYSCLHLNNDPQLTKSIFELMQQLPFDVENTKSLTLFCRPDSMIDVNQFLSVYPIDIFYAKLESLSLTVDQSDSYSIIFSLPNFQQLKYLSIYSTKTYDLSLKFTEEPISNIILFKIKTLKYFKTNGSLPLKDVNSVEKSPIEHFEQDSLSFDRLQWFYNHTVHLKSLSINRVIWSNNVYQSYTFEQLICLKINRILSLRSIQYIFQHFQNLIRLKQLEFREGVHFDCEPINGYQLENLIRQYIPQLTTFKFFFECIALFESINIDELLASFQTDFWLIEKQWFITFISQVQPLNTLYYYTEPCIRRDLKFTNPWIQITTANETNNSNINQLTLSEINHKFLESFDHFNNIQSLTLIDISPDVIYDELNRYVNISSIKHLHWKSETNFQLLFDIIKHNSNDMFLHINCVDLSKIIQSTQNSILHFENIKSLEINISYHRNYNNSVNKSIRHLGSYFPNIQTLFLRTPLTTSDITYIIGSLQFLSCLVIYYQKSRFITEEYFIKRLLRKQDKQFQKKEILHRRSEFELYLWFE